MTLPRLGDRSFDSYDKLNRELAAFNYVLRVTKPSGACNPHTLFTLNGLFLRANKLFRRHPDLPHFFQVSLEAAISQADLAIQVAHLTSACLAFEERYADLAETRQDRVAARRKLALLSD